MSGPNGYFNTHGHVQNSFNWHGSLPTVRADENLEPNFRQFDLFLTDADVPDASLVERLYKVNEGEAHWGMHTLWGGQIRAVPVVLTSIAGALFTNFVYTRLLAKSPAQVRWTILPCYLTIFAWNNWTKWYARERFFLRDWQRNQAYAFDELRNQRDKQRVREALYEKNFVKNPVAEYRIKQWEVSERFA